MLSAFFWVNRWRLNFICRRFRTLCLFHLHRRIGTEKEQSVPKRRYLKFRRRGNAQKEAYNIQNTAKVWNQEKLILFQNQKKTFLYLTLDLKIVCRNLNKGKKGIFPIREWFVKWMKYRGLLIQLPQESGLKLHISSILQDILPSVFRHYTRQSSSLVLVDDVTIATSVLCSPHKEHSLLAGSTLQWL
jgi:hypothetical protein